MKRIHFLVSILMVELVLAISGIIGFKYGEDIGIESGSQHAMDVIVHKFLRPDTKLVINGPINVTGDCKDKTFILFREDKSTFVNIGSEMQTITISGCNIYDSTRYGVLTSKD